jgi:hypothetical protein
MSDAFYAALPEAAKVIWDSLFDPSDKVPIEEISRAYFEQLETLKNTPQKPQKTAQNPPLGIYTKVSGIFSTENCQKNCDNQSLGEVYKIRANGGILTNSINDDLALLETLQLARSDRFRRQFAAAKLLSTEKNPRGGDYRVSKCLKVRVAHFVTLLHYLETNRFFYGGLLQCGSVWSCPCCSAKISEKRCLEISKAVSTHVEAGGPCYMITFTFAHKIHDDLKDLERKFAKALKKMRETYQYVKLLDEYGYFGLIKALECTYGQNGWHPHSHELFFFTKEIPPHKLSQFFTRLFDCWYNACEKVGLGLPNLKHGITIKRSYSPAEYLAKFGHHQKWGAGSELSKSNFKKSRQQTSRTVWDLLDDYEKGDKFAGAKFLEFNRVFFGKLQMVWSRGLKKLFLIEERTDEELAQLNEERAEPELFISPEDWLKVLRQKTDIRAKLLDIAERENPRAVLQFINDLSC